MRTATLLSRESIKTSKERIRKELKKLCKYVEKVYAEEQMLRNEPDFEDIDAEKDLVENIYNNLLLIGWSIIDCCKGFVPF